MSSVRDEQSKVEDFNEYENNLRKFLLANGKKRMVVLI